MVKKETIIPPNKKELTPASKLLHGKNPAGARVMADKSVAARQGIIRKSPKGR